MRELVEQEGLSPELQRCFLRKFHSKSYVPRRLLEAVAPEVRMLESHHQGRRAAEKLLPSLDLCYDSIFSMTCVQADDATLPVYFYIPDGKGWFRLIRGQCIICIDFRSIFILGYALHPEEQYNSAVIRTAFTRAFDRWGIPDLLYLERGLWKSSKLITGGEQASKADAGLPFSDEECEQGLRQFGIDFIHARRARSKAVERVIGLLQDLMEGEPGYCGRDERKDCPEATTRHKSEVERRLVRPSKHFYSFEQWEQRLFEICERYNRNQQEGKRLQGVSPEEAFHAFWNQADPPTRFDASCRYLLAHHKIPVDVKYEGVSFRVRGETYRYFDEQMGRFIGRRLIAWFNPEIPEFCTFTDRNLRNAFTVSRAQPVNALRTDALYESEGVRVQAFAFYAKTRYRVLAAKFEPVFRRNRVDAATLELGQKIEQQRGALEIAERKNQRALERGHRIARELNMPVRTEALRRPETISALERLKAVLSDESQTEVEEARVDDE